MRCKGRQLVCQNIIRGRHQHDFGLPTVYQFFQGRNPGIFHLFRVFFRIIYPDQITVCPQIDSIDLLFLKQNIREGLYSHPFIPSYKLVRHIFFVIVAILSRQQKPAPCSLSQNKFCHCYTDRRFPERKEPHISVRQSAEHFSYHPHTVPPSLSESEIQKRVIRCIHYICYRQNQQCRRNDFFTYAV